MVLLDMSMPGISGLDVCEELRNIDEGVTVLISSTFSADVKIKKRPGSRGEGFYTETLFGRVLTEKIGDSVSLRW